MHFPVCRQGAPRKRYGSLPGSKGRARLRSEESFYENPFPECICLTGRSWCIGMILSYTQYATVCGLGENWDRVLLIKVYLSKVQTISPRRSFPDELTSVLNCSFAWWWHGAPIIGSVLVLKFGVWSSTGTLWWKKLIWYSRTQVSEGRLPSRDQHAMTLLDQMEGWGHCNQETVHELFCPHKLDRFGMFAFSNRKFRGQASVPFEATSGKKNIVTSI